MLPRKYWKLERVIVGKGARNGEVYTPTRLNIEENKKNLEKYLMKSGDKNYMDGD